MTKLILGSCSFNRLNCIICKYVTSKNNSLLLKLLVIIIKKN